MRARWGLGWSAHVVVATFRQRSVGEAPSRGGSTTVKHLRHVIGGQTLSQTCRILCPHRLAAVNIAQRIQRLLDGVQANHCWSPGRIIYNIFESQGALRRSLVLGARRRVKRVVIPCLRNGLRREEYRYSNR